MSVHKKALFFLEFYQDTIYFLYKKNRAEKNNLSTLFLIFFYAQYGNYFTKVQSVTTLNNSNKLIYTDKDHKTDPHIFIRYSLLFTFIPIIDTIKNL